MKKTPTTATSDLTPNSGAADERPIRITKAAHVSPQHANAGLLLMGPLSSLSTVAGLAAECASLGEHSPGQTDFFASTAEICGEISKGNLKSVETMLMTQALSLNLLSNAMMSRATRSLAINFDRAEAYMRLALKAQNQSRMTLETLANVKNPPVVYARQANINNGGQQQVNNSTVPPASASTTHTADSQTEKTELLEQQHGQRLDTRKKSAAGSADTNLAPMGTVNRTAKPRRQD